MPSTRCVPPRTARSLPLAGAATVRNFSQLFFWQLARMLLVALTAMRQHVLPPDAGRSSACAAALFGTSVPDLELAPHPSRHAGNIGDGESQDRHMPTKVKGLEGVQVAQVACGWRHRCARCVRCTQSKGCILFAPCTKPNASGSCSTAPGVCKLAALHVPSAPPTITAGPSPCAASRLTTRARCTRGAGAPGRSSCTATASEAGIAGAAANASFLLYIRCRSRCRCHCRPIYPECCRRGLRRG